MRLIVEGWQRQWCGKGVLWCCGGAESLPTTYGTKYWHWLVWKVGAQATRVDIPPHLILLPHVCRRCGSPRPPGLSQSPWASLRSLDLTLSDLDV